MNHLRNVRVIENPAAGGGGKRETRSHLEEELPRRGASFSLARTTGPGEAGTLAREAIRAGASLVMVVGGDGTVHEVANGLLAESPDPPPLAVIPVGSGNDFRRMVGGSARGSGYVRELLDGRVRRFDAGRVRFPGGDAFFVNLLGVGVDVEILRRRAAFPRLRGLAQYLAATASALTSFQPGGFRIVLRKEEDGDPEEVVEGRTLLAAVTVGPSVGGGFLLNPAASPFDGVLDLAFVRPLGMVKIARYIPRVIRGTHLDLPELVQRQFTRCTLVRQDGEAFFFEMDGEIMQDSVRSLDIEVCRGILPVLVGKDRR